MTEERLPPQNNEAELAVLGSMLISKEALIYALEIMRGEDFYREANRLIFVAMQELQAKNEPVDVVTLVEHLKKNDNLEKTGGIAFVTMLTNVVPLASNIAYYARIVEEKAKLRRLIQASTEIAASAYEDTDNIEEIIDMAEKKILSIDSRLRVGALEPLKDIVLSSFTRLEKRSGEKGHLTGLSTGFRDLDYMTSGLQASDLILVAARPSMGKTAFTLNIARNVAYNLKKTVAFFSLEMSKDQLAQRLLSSESGIDSQTLKNGLYNNEDWTELISAADRLFQIPIYIDDTPGITVMELRSKARRLKATEDLSLIVIDYLQLMQGRNTKSLDNRQQEISDISRSLKALARELDVPVIALSQLSRSVEARQIKKPMLSDLRESGSLEQDADIVIFLYREDYYLPDSEKKNVTDIIIAKHRNGPVGSIELYFKKEFTKFTNYEAKIQE